ncbi:MAG: hypothetical protein K2R98_11190 [Gemmataceae bacterium]|nr:hypothetical protein [Gemmataceae bacterium]
MRNLLAFVSFAVLAFLGVGWYLDWYTFKPVASADPNHQSYNLDIHRDKIARDVVSGVQKGEEKLQNAMDTKAAGTGAAAAKGGEEASAHRE